MTQTTAEALIAQLDLAPHPEGGHYRQTWVAETGAAGRDGRPLATCIYFLLKPGERSHWHKVDAAELWLWHAGAPLTLRRAASDDGPARADILGPDVLAGHAPQLLVEKDHWQAAVAGDSWSLVSCVVSPGFTFDGFTLAEPGFDIPN